MKFIRRYFCLYENIKDNTVPLIGVKNYFFFGDGNRESIERTMHRPFMQYLKKEVAFRSKPEVRTLKPNRGLYWKGGGLFILLKLLN